VSWLIITINTPTPKVKVGGKVAKGVKNLKIKTLHLDENIIDV
jgi:hypothetical protein